MTKVLVTVPNIHWIHRHVVHSLLALQVDRRYRLRIELPCNKPYENNQHHIVEDFLKGDDEFWLSIDADNPPLNNPLDLVQLDRDVVGLPTPVYHWTGQSGERPIYWNVYKKSLKDDGYHEHQDRTGLQRVDAIGTGCFVIARRVFEHPALQQGAFARKLNANGTVHKGNDISFCERATEAGFEIYAHFDYPCRHFCEIDLHDMALAIKGLL